MLSKNRFETLLAWEETYSVMSVNTVYSVKSDGDEISLST